VRPPTLKIYPYAFRNEREMSFVYFYFQVVLPAPEEFDGAVIEGQQFVVTASGGNEQNSARVTIEREPTGHLFTRGLEMISKGNRFVRVEGEYIAQAVDVDRGYLKTSVSMERPPVIRICCGPADWVSSLQVVKLGCCDVGYHGVPFLAKALRTLPLTTLHLRENVCIGSNFGCLAGAAPPITPPPPLHPLSPRHLVFAVASRSLHRSLSDACAAALQFCTALTDLNLTSVSLGSHGAGVRSIHPYPCIHLYLILILVFIFHHYPCVCFSF
jgi:hypothetical protein